MGLGVLLTLVTNSTFWDGPFAPTLWASRVTLWQYASLLLVLLLFFRNDRRLLAYAVARLICLLPTAVHGQREECVGETGLQFSIGVIEFVPCCWCGTFLVA